DRAKTISDIVDPHSTPHDFLRPGHIFPLGALDGGVLVRAGHTEAIVALCRLASPSPAGVICEILNDDCSMDRLRDLRGIARDHCVKIVSIRDLIAYRTQNETLVQRVVSTRIPNPYGTWNLHLYENKLNNEEIIALELGEPAKQDSALIRVHSK